MAGAVLVLALVGARFQDRKKEALMGAAWSEWERKTSYWPRWGKLFSAGFVLWVAALATWLLVTWLHIPSGASPAGVWRWIG